MPLEQQFIRPIAICLFWHNGRFPDESLYHQPQLQAREDNGTPFKAIWKPLTDFQGNNAPPLYPDGLPKLIATLL